MEWIILIVVTLIWWKVLAGRDVRRGITPYFWLYILWRGVDEIKIDSEGQPALGLLSIKSVKPLHIDLEDSEYCYISPNCIESMMIKTIEQKVLSLDIAMDIIEGLDEYHEDKWQ